MEPRSSATDAETSPFLQDRNGVSDQDGVSEPSPKPHSVPERALRRLLPVALLAALAMASTSATAYFAYAALLCKDPRHCQNREAGRYAGFVAASTSIANMIGLCTLGYLQKLAITHRKRGLFLWLICRSMSAVMLLLGVSAKNIYIALSGHLFEGLASDNLLHFTLNAVYSQSQVRETASSLIAYSLALYMLGVSVSPFVAGLFGNFTISFLLALGIFFISILYLQFAVRGLDHTKNDSSSGIRRDNSTGGPRSDILGRLGSGLGAAISPLEPFRREPTYLLTGLSLLTYNVAQSYTFNALLVYSTVKFGFTGRENGYVLSMAHSVGALYVFATLFLIPRFCRLFGASDDPQHAQANFWTKKRDIILSSLSLIVQTMALTVLGLATQARDVYISTVLLAVGLPTPSFIKGYTIGMFDGDEKPKALAALAIMETLGSVLGPISLGGFQSYYGVNGDVFFAASGLTSASLILLAVGSVAQTRRRD